jgi:serine/threonine protein kinase
MVGTIKNFECVSTLGSGASCKVKLAIDKNSGRKVAVKIMNDSMSSEMKKLVITEVNAMAGLNHVHVIKQIETGNAPYTKKNGTSKNVDYIVLELA